MKTISIALAILLIFITSNSVAYNSNSDLTSSNYGPDHQRITQFAIANLNYREIFRGVLKQYETTINKANEAEDSYINLIHHFYDPEKMYVCVPGDESICFLPNARASAISNYEAAITLYNRKRDLLRSFSHLGSALHLLQDMAVPSHVRSGLDGMHLIQSVFTHHGYEWWVTKNWDSELSNDSKNGYLDKIFNIQQFKYSIVAGDMAGFIDIMSQQTRYGGYPYDSTEIGADNIVIAHTVTDGEAEYSANMLIPMIIRMSGGLLEKFCREINCGGPPTPAPNNSNPGGGHPDDNFDVSSRLIELEQLDVTKQAWKDLFGRTGIKKGYNGLFLEALQQNLWVSSGSGRFPSV